jgi:glycosyltransferase involved in cell wall biosynthesis
MQFSFIVPTYNEEQYIEPCLNSIRQQNLQRTEYEVIVSDGNSHDHTRDRAARFADRIVINEKRGASVQRNYGAKHATGDVLVFIDADTKICPDFLSILKIYFTDPATVAVTGIAFPADGYLPQRFVFRATYWLVYVFHWLHLSLFPGMCVAYRRDAFESVQGFCEDYTTLEDLDLSKRIAILGKTQVASKAHAYTSTRRIEKHLISTVAYHIYCDARYLITGKAPRRYPKVEELQSWRDLWKSL